MPRHEAAFRRRALPVRALPAILLLSGAAHAEESSAVHLEELSVTGQGGYTTAPAGLNLDTPTRGGSRLGLSPRQTPASIEIIPGQKIRERGQETVQEAVTQNATGITTIGAPGNGFSSYPTFSK